jgi:F0F1-type ATP synthase alpha subunit
LTISDRNYIGWYECRYIATLGFNNQYSPLSVAEMATSLFAANSGSLDDLETNKVVDFEAALIAYMNANQTTVL